MSEGKIVIDGPPAKALDPALFTGVYGVPIERFEVNGGAVPVLLPRIKP